MGTYSTRKWRKTRKIPSYKRERVETKKRKFWPIFNRGDEANLFFSKLHFFDADRAELRHSNLVCGGLEDAIDCNTQMLRSGFKTGFPLFFLYLLLLCATEYLVLILGYSGRVAAEKCARENRVFRSNARKPRIYLERAARELNTCKISAP